MNETLLEIRYKMAMKFIKEKDLFEDFYEWCLTDDAIIEMKKEVE